MENNCQVLPITIEIAKRSRELQGQLRLSGKTHTQADMMIAATAQIHQLTLVTRNIRDFDGCGIPLLNPFS
ncbi:PIN domain-containing protein [Nostoc sp.]|uniref:PIN domain-containing protein n=1 Tax=Nostoc sp. TaxID=1180 RepID=UPI002FF4AD4F